MARLEEAGYFIVFFTKNFEINLKMLTFVQLIT